MFARCYEIEVATIFPAILERIYVISPTWIRIWLVSLNKRKPLFLQIERMILHAFIHCKYS